MSVYSIEYKIIRRVNKFPKCLMIFSTCDIDNDYYILISLYKFI